MTLIDSGIAPHWITRSLAEPIRGGLSVDENFGGTDAGTICCWEQGRTLATKSPEMSQRAKDGELPQITTWVRSSQLYFAFWQGLRGDDLVIDVSRASASAHQCSLTKQWWAASSNRERCESLQKLFDSEYLKVATLDWCWHRGNELREASHRLAGPASDGVLEEMPFTFERGTPRYYALWQGLRGNDLDITNNEDVEKNYFAIQCASTTRWWAFSPNTRPAMKWRTQLQSWIDSQNPEAIPEDNSDG